MADRVRQRRGPDLTARVSPGGPRHVVITSRNPDWHGLAQPIPVPEFIRAESREVLQTRLALSATDADAITDSVGDLPLAVDQTAALLEQTGLESADYRRELSARSSAVYARGRDDSAARLWAMSFDRLEADDPPAAALLTLLAWLARIRCRTA